MDSAGYYKYSQTLSIKWWYNIDTVKIDIFITKVADTLYKTMYDYS